jgi:parvulin-like peptidyl-prolyl isomerase
MKAGLPARTVAPASARQESPSTLREPIARIGKRAITRGELKHWVSIGFYGRIGAPEPPTYAGCVSYLGLSASETTTNEQLRLICKQKYGRTLHKALSLLIHAPWLIGEAAKAGIRIDRAKLARETALSGPRGEETKQILATKGETLSDFRLTLTLIQLSARLDRKLEAQMPITAARIAAYYRRHRDSLRSPERRDLHIVRFASLGEARKAKREIEHGTSFATIAKRTSLVQPGGAEYGLLFGLRPENWPEEPLAEDIFHAPLRTLQGPVRISLGYYVFEVIGKSPSRPTTLAEAKPEVVRKLHKLLQEQVFARFAKVFTNKWAARTACLPSDLLRYCREARSTPTSPLEVPNLLF